MSFVGRVYWANALFTSADRAFNQVGADHLRSRGYEVFLPQDATVNHELAPTAEAVFRVDTCAILSSNIMVACLDHETIDCGVACEVGLAFAYGIPVVGLYTDVRQHRVGQGKMYKNLYVIGAISACGTIVNSVEALPAALDQVRLRSGASDALAIEHFSDVVPQYHDYVARLETWYSPGWSAGEFLSNCIERVNPRRVLEYGCGTGVQGQSLVRNRTLTYVGYDGSSKMIEMARSRCSGSDARFTSAFEDIVVEAEREPFDLAFALFSLHDHVDKESAMAALTSCLRPSGHLFVLDLSKGDLPELTARLRYALPAPAFAKDPRLDGAWFASTADSLGLAIREISLHVPRLSFPSAGDLDDYLRVFGVYQGMDLPLGLKGSDTPLIRGRILEEAAHWSYPMTDRRVFIQCLLQKR